MMEQLNDLSAYLRDNLDPDQIVDFLAISSDDLVDALQDFIYDWLQEGNEVEYDS